MLPIWLNLLLTIPLYLMMLYLGLLILNLKIRYMDLIITASIVAGSNIGLEQWLGNPIVKVVIPIIIMIWLYAYLVKINMYKSAIVAIMGANVYFFIESITMLISYNLLKIYPVVYLYNSLINIIVTLFMLSIGMGIIVLIKSFDWKLYNLAQMADNSRKDDSILTALLLFMGIPSLIYCFIAWLSFYTMTISVIDIALILNTANVIFLLYFFAACFSLKRAEYALEKVFKDKADSSMIALLQHFFETNLPGKDQVKPKTPLDYIPFPQLRLFFQVEYALAQERKVDFIVAFTDLSGLEVYIDDAFIRMLKNLYENAFEAVESAEFKEIYSEITKENDGGFTIIIKNNGEILPGGHQNQPFIPGYTTKNAPDRGYGLYKVNKLIDYYQGSIDLRGSDGYTQVTVKLPYKAQHMPIQPEKPVLTLIKNEI